MLKTVLIMAVLFVLLSPILFYIFTLVIGPK
jgi:hypothetical protein